MRRIQLGGSQRSFAAVGLGCMGMSWGYDELGRDESESIGVIRHAVDIRADLIDTADHYGPFTNEVLVGKALAKPQVQAQLSAAGVEPLKGDADELARLIRAQTELYGRIAREANIQPN